MFILGDESHERGRVPWVTFMLLGFNFLFFCAQVRFGDRLTVGFAVVPKEITELHDLRGKHEIKVPQSRHVGIDEQGEPIIVSAGFRTHVIQHYPGPAPIFLTLLTYMFLHGDIFHLVFNMWFLWIFGRNVECALGNGRFLGFYVGCGIFAGLSQVACEPRSIVPMVGASGAIAAVMGAYLAIFPFNKIRVLVGNLAMVAAGAGVIELPAFVVIGAWFLLQYIAAAAAMNGELVGGTAIWCHLGGFLAGFLTIKLTVLYLNYRIREFEAEQEPKEELPDGALAPSPEISPEELDAIEDPVEAFRKARMGVFRDTPENDPFQPERAAPRPPSHGDELSEAIRRK